MEKRAICLLVIGDKYKKLYKKMAFQFSEYAKKCKSEIIVIDEIPDPTFHRPLLSQKLLLPSLLLSYDCCLFLDLDIIISSAAPSIFNLVPENKSFAAIIDPRGTEEFYQTWRHIPRILNESTDDYFYERNFPKSENLMGSINGGVFVFRPKEVVHIFSDYYFSDHNQGLLNSFEETPMAYLTQTKKIFYPLDIKFNTQIMYKLKGTESGRLIEKNEQKIPGFLRKRYYKKKGVVFYPIYQYKKFTKKLLEENYFIHFAGNYPIPNF